MNLTNSDDALTPAPVDASGEVVWRGVQSPAALLGVNPNYVLPSLLTANGYRLLPAGGGSTISGFVAPIGVRQLLMVWNRSAVDSLTLLHDDAGSAAGNRFLLAGGVARVVLPYGGVWVWYDTDSAAWRVL